MMKLALTAAAAFALAAPALAEEWDFVLINKTTKTIKAVEISPGGAGTWVAEGDPEVKRKPAAPGAKMTIHFDKGSGCKYDLRVTFSDDTTGVWSGIDTCKFSFVTISYRSDGTPSVAGN